MPNQHPTQSHAASATKATSQSTQWFAGSPAASGVQKPLHLDPSSVSPGGPDVVGKSDYIHKPYQPAASAPEQQIVTGKRQELKPLPSTLEFIASDLKKGHIYGAAVLGLRAAGFIKGPIQEGSFLDKQLAREVGPARWREF